MSGVSGSAPGHRWQGRPVAAAAVRAVALLLPFLLAAAAAVVVGRAVPGGTALRLAAALLVAVAVAALASRAARRLAPLAALLDLSLLFPDRAPSRFATALRAGSTRELALTMTGQRGRPPAEAAADVVRLLAALARHDRDTRRHTERVRAYTDLLAESLRLPGPDRDRLRWAALLHDLGKLTVDPAVLGKPSSLDTEEWHAVRGHPAAGEALAADLEPFLGEWFTAVGQHHERWDGGGYPQGLAGEQIGRAARIVSVADSFEVMTAGRPYRGALDAGTARTELVACSGTQFDPDVVRAMLEVSVSRLERVAGPLAFLASAPVVAPEALDPLVSVASGAALHPAAQVPVGTAASGVDAAGSGPPSGQDDAGGGAGAAADLR